jgi:soluble P-type ATPase
MIMEKNITKNGIKYELRGEQYYPMLEISEQTNYEIGKYGHLHLDFIKNHRRGTYTTLLTEGRLNEHLHNIDELTHEQIDLYIAQTAERMGVTEEFKASDPMRWVQMMNNIKASAEEIVLKEVVYK